MMLMSTDIYMHAMQARQRVSERCSLLLDELLLVADLLFYVQPLLAKINGAKVKAK